MIAGTKSGASYLTLEDLHEIKDALSHQRNTRFHRSALNHGVVRFPKHQLSLLVSFVVGEGEDSFIDEFILEHRVKKEGRLSSLIKRSQSKNAFCCNPIEVTLLSHRETRHLINFSGV